MSELLVFVNVLQTRVIEYIVNDVRLNVFAVISAV